MPLNATFQRFLDSFRGIDFVEPVVPYSQSNLVLVSDFGVLYDPTAPNTENLLEKFCLHHKECCYTREVFPSAMWKYRNPPDTIMGFTSGIFVSVGSKHLYETLFLFQVLRIQIEEFRREYYPDFPPSRLTFGHPKEENLVFTASIPNAPFDLAEMAATLQRVRYKPNKFPGANIKIRLSNGVSVMAVGFASGKANFMGVRQESWIPEVLDIFTTMMQPFRTVERGPTDDITAQRIRELEEAKARAQRHMLPPDEKEITKFGTAEETQRLEDMIFGGGTLLLV